MPIQNELKVKNDIKNNIFYPCYIIFGNDGYLKKQLAESITNAIAPSDDIFNFYKFSGECSLQEVFDAKEQLPVMADRKCILLKDYDFEKCDKEDFEKLLLLLSEKNDDTVLVLWFDRINFDKKDSEKAKKLLSAAEKGEGIGVIVNHRSTPELVKMITGAVSKRGAKISSDTARFMIEYVGDDIETIKNEIEKICAFALSSEITKATVKKICVATIEQSVYELSSVILRGEVGTALSILDELFFMRVKPIIILSAISSFYVDLFRVYCAKSCSVPLQTLADTFSYGNRTFVLEKMATNLRKISYKQLKLSMEEIVKADKALKNFSGRDRTVLEETVVKLSYIATKGEALD